MKSQKMKQWIKDYLDFAMPLIMVIVALNLVDLLIDLPYYYNPEHYTPKLADFFKINAHLSVFMEQVTNLNLRIGSIIFLGSVLLLRLFTNRLFVVFSKPFNIFMSIFVLYNFFVIFAKQKEADITFFAFMLTYWIIIVTFVLISFSTIKIFFANFPKIKNIAYIVVSILIVLLWTSYYFAIQNILNDETLDMVENIADNKMIYFTKWILLIATLSLTVISAIGCFVLEILEKVFKRGTLITPNDITEWEIDAKLDAEAEREAKRQKRERNRIISNIADEVRKRL